MEENQNLGNPICLICKGHHSVGNEAFEKKKNGLGLGSLNSKCVIQDVVSYLVCDSS